MNKILLAGASVAFALVCGLFVFAPSVQAAGRYGSSDANFIKADEVVDGASYLVGNTVNIEGKINGDVYCAGSDLVINGVVNGDVICAGASVTINGKVSGDVRIAGKNITIGGEIAGNATVFGSTVTVETAAKIGHDAVLGGGDVLVNGTVGRDLVISAQTATVNGPVARDVEGSYGALNVGKDAVVGGFLHYTSDSDAIVRGTVSGGTKRDQASTYTGRKVDIVQSMVMFAVIMVAWTVLTALALRLIFPKKMQTVTNLSFRDVIFAISLGIVSLIAVPMLAVILITSIIALPLGIALIFAWLALGLVSTGVTAIYIGRVIFKDKINPIAATMFAALGLGVLYIIPLVNIIAVAGSLIFGTGAVIYAVRGEHEKGTKNGPKIKLAKV